MTAGSLGPHAHLWPPHAADGLWDIHNTFLSASETLTEVHVRIVHTPSDTIVVDETYDDVVDVS